MENEDLLTRIRTRHAADLRACFPSLSERDLMQILTAPRYAINILQGCFGGNAEEAKAAWNDFVLRHIDGPHSFDSSGTSGSVPELPIFPLRKL